MSKFIHLTLMKHYVPLSRETKQHCKLKLHQQIVRSYHDGIFLVEKYTNKHKFILINKKIYNWLKTNNIPISHRIYLTEEQLLEFRLKF